jgi:hypothetical protein
MVLGGLFLAWGCLGGQAEGWAEVTLVFSSILVADSQVYHPDPSLFLSDASSARKEYYLSIRSDLHHVRKHLSQYPSQQMEEDHGLT